MLLQVVADVARACRADPDLAADGVQDALLDLVKRVREGRDPGRRDRDGVRYWVVEGAGFAIGKRRRSCRRRREDAEPGEELPDIGPSPHVIVETEEGLAACRVRVVGLLASLSERDRRLMELLYLDEMPPGTVAASLGMAAGALYVARHRALGRLRRAAAGWA
ncbi:MAG: sigma-70 family RNA polymerase sigma factor [Deltaproteobacteria bacterium]|nr:sigma-70 family RNA polymerase sigma factor [Deltaproteobacteria bacterium]